MKWMDFVRQFWSRRALALPATGLLLLLMTPPAGVAPVPCAARPADKPALRRQAPPPKPPAGGAAAWSFEADGAQAKRWRQGISGAELQHKAVARAARASKPAAATRREEKGGENAGKTGAASENSGIYLSWERDITTWQPETPRKIRQAGETFSLHQRHIVRAQARAGTSDASVSVGPEVILKDGNDKALAKDPNSPDSAVGFGMHFMVGF